MQETLDEYKAGVEVVEVQLQKADPPSSVIDSFRDVVNAAQDAETKVNQATSIQNDIVPKARGEAAQIIQDAEAYKGRVVAEAEGEAERFVLVLEEYKAAPRVTRDQPKKSSSIIKLVMVLCLTFLLINLAKKQQEHDNA